jgi:DNA invertase Pin-like site-specific DNA recombinase
MTKAFAYLRVSGRGQIDGDGFPRQREAIKRYANAHGIRIVTWFEERGQTGKSEWEARPAWTEMVQSLNGVETIIVERLDRLARELGVQEYIIRDLTKRHVTLISAAEESIDADPTRVLFRQIMGAIAQYDRTMIEAKLKAARVRQRASTGRCEGRKPYGSRPGEQEILDRMRSMRNSGSPYDAIATEFNAGGVPTRMGRGWFGSTVAKILRAAGH